MAAVDTTPPGPVTALVVTPASTSAVLSWTNPTATDLAGVMIRRAAGATPPASATAGTPVARVAKPGTTYTDTALAADKTYSYALFAYDARPNYSTSVTRTVRTPAVTNPGVVHVCGTLETSRTWAPTTSPVYVVDCPTMIVAGASLTVDAGAVVKFAAGAQLTVNGSFRAVGTTAAPITFTFVADDTVGGDTNADADTTVPAYGDWRGVGAYFSTGSRFTMDRVNVRYGGNVSVNYWSSPGAVSVTDSTFGHSGFLSVSSAGTLTLTGNTLTDMQHCDRLSASSYGTAALTVTGNTLRHVPGDRCDNEPGMSGAWRSSPVRCSMNPARDLPRSDHHRQHGDRCRTDRRDRRCAAPGPGQAGRQHRNRNVMNSLGVAGGVTSDLTLPVAAGLPWIFNGSTTFTATATLTLPPGAVVKFVRQAGLILLGTLKASGTATAPITLTTITDDTVGGDTNGDGDATGPADTNWSGGIASYGSPGSSVTMKRVNVRYGGNVGMLTDGAASIVDSTFYHSGSVGVGGSGAVTLSGNTMTDMEACQGIGAVSYGTGALSVTGNSVDPLPGMFCGSESWRSGAVNVTAYSVLDDSGVEVSPVPTVTDNRVTGSGLIAVTVDAPRLDAARLTGNTGTGNAFDNLGVTGTLTHDLTFPVATDLPWIFTGPMTVGAGTTLTLSPGAVVKFAPAAGLIVLGTLKASGTPTARITLTSLADDTVGGDTNGDGDATVPAYANWTGISASFSAGSSFTMDRVNVRCGGNVTVEYLSGVGAVSVTNSTFRQTGFLSANGAGAIRLNWNTLIGMQHCDRLIASSFGTAALSVSFNRLTYRYGSALCYYGPGEAGSVEVTADPVRDGTGTEISSVPTVTGNSVVDSDLMAVLVTAQLLQPSKLTGNTGSGNLRNTLGLRGALAEDTTLPVTSGLPVEISGPLTVNPGITLAMSAGAVLKFGLQTGPHRQGNARGGGDRRRSHRVHLSARRQRRRGHERGRRHDRARSRRLARHHRHCSRRSAPHRRPYRVHRRRPRRYGLNVAPFSRGRTRCPRGRP